MLTPVLLGVHQDQVAPSTNWCLGLFPNNMQDSALVLAERLDVLVSPLLQLIGSSVCLQEVFPGIIPPGN